MPDDAGEVPQETLPQKAGGSGEPVATERLPTACYQFEAKAAQVVSVLDRYIEDLKTGRAPSRDELLANHPELAEQLRECLTGIEFIHQAGSVVSGTKTVGEYRIIREIGRGGMGAVYEAEQTSLGRRVALKVLRFGTVSDRDALQRFQREAETVAKLHHTNIVPIFSVGNEQGVNYYAMQYIEGRSLDQILKQNQHTLQPNQVAEWGLQAAEALAHAHQREVIHRDVKPSNLILDGEDRIWLTDFGLAKHMDDVTLSMTGALLGTPRYMSPEQAAATTKKVDHRTDIYSLGATLYELTTGQPVFSANTPHRVILQILSDEPRPLRTHRPNLPRDLETIILKCLSKDPSQRYESAKELADELRAYLDGRPIQARRPTLAKQAVLWLKRQQRSVALTASAVAVTCVLLIGSLVGWYQYQNWQLSRVTLTTDNPPLVAEVLRKDGMSVSGRVTVPTQQSVSVPSGEYVLRVSSEQELSQTYAMHLGRGQAAKFDLDVADDQVPGKLNFQRTFALVDFSRGGRFDTPHTRILLMDEVGIRLHDDQREEWLLELSQTALGDVTGSTAIVWPWNAAVSGVEHSGYGKFDIRPTIALFQTPGENDGRRPADSLIRGHAVDLNGDGEEDFVLAARHQAWLLAVSGSDGTPLWFSGLGEEFQSDVTSSFRRNRHLQGVLSAVLYPPRFVDDVNEDGVVDIIAVIADIGTGGKASEPIRWVEAFSGVDGRTIWRHQLSDALFAISDEEEPPYHLRWFVKGTGGLVSEGGRGITNWRGRTRRWSVESVQREGTHVHIPDDLHVDQVRRRVSIIAGTHIVCLDVSTGQEIGQPVKTDVLPGLPGRWGDVDGDGADDVVLVEQLPDKVPSPTSPLNDYVPQARIAAWSFAKRRSLWQRDVDAKWPRRPEWHATLPRWPAVVDLEGDGMCEVITPNGTSIGSWRRHRSTPWGAIEVLEGTTGSPRWSHRLLNMDQWVERFTVGPDVDNDGVREVFAASLWGEDVHLYVDCLSGADGRSLWWARHQLNSHGPLTWRYRLGPLSWWQQSPDGWSQLVATAQVIDTGYGNNSAVCAISAGTGRINRVGGMMPRTHTSDFDGDGTDELLVHRTKQERTLQSLDHGGTLELVRGTHDMWRRIDDRWETAGDFDGDGLLDLLQTKDDNIRALSGVNGNLLWEKSVADPVPRQSVARPEWDLNGDGIADLLRCYIRRGLSSAGEAESLIHAHNGRTGEKLWEADVDAEIQAGMPIVECRDLDGDGQLEIVSVSAMNHGYKSMNYSYQATQLWLVVLSGETGHMRWKQPISADYGGSVGTHIPYRPAAMSLEITFADLNGDSVLDVLLPAESSSTPPQTELRCYSGRNGELLWSRALSALRDKRHLLDQIPAPVVGDLDGDKELEAVVLMFQEGKDQDGRHQRFATLSVLNAADGQEKWSWRSEVDSDCGDVGDVDHWQQERPRPILLRAEKKALICLNLYRDTQRMVVLDDAGKAMVDQSLPSEGRPRQFRVWACDADCDGHDEALLWRDGKMVALRPIDLDVLWEQAERNDDYEVLAITHGAHDQSPTIVTRTARGNNQVCGLDAATGKTRWVCHGPSPAGSGYTRVPSAVLLGKPVDSISPDPLVLFGYNNTLVARRATRVDQNLGVKTTDDSTIHRGQPSLRPSPYDPRLYRPLPWSISNNDKRGELVLMAVWTSFYSMTLLVLPIGFASKLVRQKRWSLRYWLMLPAVVASFTFGLMLPGPSSQTFSWDQKLWMAIAAFPAILIVAQVSRWLIFRQWRKLRLWFLMTIVLAVAVALYVMLLVVPHESGPLLPGESYSADGWYLVWLIGAYLTGCVMAFLIPIGQLLKSIPRSRRELAT